MDPEDPTQFLSDSSEPEEEEEEEPVFGRRLAVPFCLKLLVHFFSLDEKKSHPRNCDVGCEPSRPKVKMAQPLPQMTPEPLPQMTPGLSPNKLLAS